MLRFLFFHMNSHEQLLQSIKKGEAPDASSIEWYDQLGQLTIFQSS